MGQNSDLLSLPPEILDDILARSQPESIQALLRTCKELHQIALPISVRAFRIVECTKPHRKRAFLRYITITKPDLDVFVRSIIFDSFTTTAVKYDSPDSEENEIEDEDEDKDTETGGDDIGEKEEEEGVEDYKEKDKRIRLVPGEREIYQKIINGCVGESDTEKWKRWRRQRLQDLGQGFGDAYVALLLAVCPKLQLLCLSHAYRPRNTLRLAHIAAQRSHSTSQQRQRPLLGHLQDLYLE